MRINGTNHYIGRSTSGSYITSNSIWSTRINTQTSGGYSTQYYTYGGAIIYTIIRRTSGFDFCNEKGDFRHYDNTNSYTSAYSLRWESSDTGSYTFDSSFTGPGGEYGTYEYENRCTGWYTLSTYNGGSSQQILTATSNAYYTTTMTNVANITVSTTKSASSSSHNFV